MIVIILIICTPFIWWYLNLRKFKSLDKIPGPKPLPFLGNAMDLGSTPQDLLKTLNRYQKEYGNLYKIYVGSELKVVITKPEMLENILNSSVHITKSHAYDLLEPWLGTGLLVSTGTKWKSRRKMITPTFHFKILDKFVEVFNSAGDILVKNLSSEVGKESIDMFNYINLCSLDIICETAMGVKTKTQENGNKTYVSAVRDYLNIFIVRMFSAWEQNSSLFKLSKRYPVFKRNLEILHNFTNDIIRERREKKSKENLKITPTDNGNKHKTALLDMLLDSEDNELLTNEDIREEIDTFMFEGHDTTTAGTVFVLFALANHPDIQQQVYEEVLSITESKDTTYLTMQDLQEMKYLEMVIKESQRLYPPVPFIERKLQTDFHLGGYDFPKDTILNLFIYGLHHSEECFPSPEKFDPYRFLPENQSLRHNYAYLPFSAGPRNCIGQKFAMLEMKIMIAKTVKMYHILPVPNYQPDLGMAGILKSYNGVCLQLRHREKN